MTDEEDVEVKKCHACLLHLSFDSFGPKKNVCLGCAPTGKKWCNKCRTVLGESSFGSRGGVRGALLSSWCRLCVTSYRREYRASPSGATATQRSRRKWAAANPSSARSIEQRLSDISRAAAWKARNPERAKILGRRNTVKRYGLTIAAWDELFRSQGEVCASCASDAPMASNWCTDHDHDTGLVRGILCGPCNKSLGALGDSLASVSSRAEMFVRYLESVNERMSAIAGLRSTETAPRPKSRFQTRRKFAPAFVSTFESQSTRTLPAV